MTVAPGAYNVAVIGATGYASQVYSGLSCPSTPFCVTTGGSQVVVAEGGTASDVNFALIPGTTGGITGTVTNAAGGGPLQNIQVQVISLSGFVVGSATTNASGVYSFAGLAPGSYYVRTNGNTNFINQVAPNIVCVACNVTLTPGATPVAVAGGGTTTVDFALNGGAHIQGTVTNIAGGAALQGINMQLFSSTGISMGTTNTSASGTYSFFAVPPGNYYVRTGTNAAQNFVDQVYSGRPCAPCPVMSGDAVAVVGTTNTTGINFTLSSGGTISGTVTDSGAGGAPVALMQSLAIDTNGVNIKSAVTDASGNYSIAGLPTGIYIVRANPNPAWQNYAPQIYNGIPFNGSQTFFTPVDVTVGATHSGVNFALSSGGSISGTITGDGGTPLASVSVAAYSAITGRPVKAVITDASGFYVITGLAAGTYRVGTGTPSIQTPYYIDELYDNFPCVGCIPGGFASAVILPCAPACTPSVTTSTPVAVTNGATHTGVDFSLASGAGVITGFVRGAGGGIGLTGVTVALFNGSGQLVKAGVSQVNSGLYFVRGLAPGTYYARTIASPATPFYQDIAFGGAACVSCDVVATSTPIIVTANNATAADFLLPAGGSISGLVTDSATSGWLAFVNVQLYNGAGTLVKTTFTSSTGTYNLNGLSAGTYFVRTAVSGGNAIYGDMLFNGISCVVSCTVTSGNAINVTNGATQSANFALVKKPTIAPIPNVVTRMNTPANVPVTVGSAAGAAGVTLNALSSNTTLVPNTNFGASGSGANRTLTITPAANQLGTTTITVFASDSTGSSNRQFALSVAGTRGDSNGDTRSDILWRNTVTGQPVSWFMNGDATLGGTAIGPIDIAWELLGTADFNGDGRADYLWRHITGPVAIWFMNGGVILGGTAFGSPGPTWQIAGAGDYNGDGRADLLWRDVSGTVAIWFVNGAVTIGGAVAGTMDPVWQIAGTGDYNADGFADILWRNTVSGEVVIWLMNGGTVIGGGSVATVPLAYQVAGTGDYNGDGRSDILWRNAATGTVSIWDMDGTAVIASGPVATVPLEYQIVATGDYNGDGKSDILWRHTNGSVVMWLMNGTTIIGGSLFTTLDPVWQIINLK